MEYTDEYEMGWGAWARYFDFDIVRHKHYAKYSLPSNWENGWITEVHPTDGLFAASAWFKPEKTLDYKMNIGRPCLMILCVDCGDITITQKGLPARKIGPFNQLIISLDNPLRLTFPAGIHVCFTSILIFDSFIEKFLTANDSSYPIRVSDAKRWKIQHVDSPNVVMVMEQIRWGVRGDRLPPLAYFCKSIELLCIIAHNMEREQHTNVRRHYVTWDNEKKLYRVRERINENPLISPPIQELCLLAEMSESKLRISFKSLYGLTISAYTREAVMKRAMQMLADDSLNIKNIAALCGYQNPAKFAAVFKQIHGITPSAFRKEFGL